MTTTLTDPSPNTHEDIEALLPWYANGTLTPNETTTVEQHLAHCAACRQELAQCQALAKAIHQEHQMEDWQPAPDGFDRLLAQIDPMERKSASAATRRPTLLEHLRNWLGTTPNPVRWTLGLESMAVAALLLMVALPGTRPLSDYETLSDAAHWPSTTGPRLRVVFADATTVKEIQNLLQEIDGGIITGPTALGVYTIALPKSEPTAHLVADVVGKLRARPQVRLVETLNDGGSL